MSDSKQLGTEWFFHTGKKSGAKPAFLLSQKCSNGEIAPLALDDQTKRPLGILKDKGGFSFVGDGKITDEDLL